MARTLITPRQIKTILLPILRKDTEKSQFYLDKYLDEKLDQRAALLSQKILSEIDKKLGILYWEEIEEILPVIKDKYLSSLTVAVLKIGLSKIDVFKQMLAESYTPDKGRDWAETSSSNN